MIMASRSLVSDLLKQSETVLSYAYLSTIDMQIDIC